MGHWMEWLRVVLGPCIIKVRLRDLTLQNHWLCETEIDTKHHHGKCFKFNSKLKKGKKIA
jgi:hypothetical protein